ncbi:MAG: hypothetical protein AAGK14_04850 [Verrucomicrobiota bacterium]
MKKLLLLTVAACSLGLGAVHAAETPKVIAAKFHKDTCGTCKVLAPEVDALRAKYGDQDVLFITFDRSSPASQNQAELLASGLGVAEAYEGNPGAGFLLLIDAESKDVLDKLKGQDAAAMGEKLATSLK